MWKTDISGERSFMMRPILAARTAEDKTIQDMYYSWILLLFDYISGELNAFYLIKIKFVQSCDSMRQSIMRYATVSRSVKMKTTTVNTTTRKQISSLDISTWCAYC